MWLPQNNPILYGPFNERGLSSSSCGCLVLVLIVLVFVSAVVFSLIR
jgi:hypothetical protein